MKKIKVTVDLEADTKEEMVRMLQELIWEVKRVEQPQTRRPPAIWPKLGDKARAELAAEYVQLRETANGSAVQALADAHDWDKSFAISCISRMRGQGYLAQTEPGEKPALGEKSKVILDALSR